MGRRSGADANVQLASCNDTASLPGILIAAQNLVDAKTPPAILSLSFSECEAALGPGGNTFLQNMWQQAASEGISVFVSAGDGASDACDDPGGQAFASSGLGVSGFASTPYNFAAGGTDFLDTIQGEISTYWNATNSSTGGSARSYVPETPWNQSCASILVYTFFGFTDPISFCNSQTDQDFYIDIVGGGGGASSGYSKPSWQAGIPGIPNDHTRDLPDVSLFASGGFFFHSLLFCMSDPVVGGSPCHYSNPTDALLNSAGGISFTAPQFASIQALINQGGWEARQSSPSVLQAIRKRVRNGV